MIDKNSDPSQSLKSTPDDRLDVFANLIVDRILEEKQLYMESFKKDPNSKKDFDSQKFLKFVKIRIKKSKSK